MDEPVKLLDVVALTEDLPQRELRRGHVGTVVEALDAGVWEVEFSDEQGRTYATAAVRHDQMLVLRHRPVAAA